MRLICPIKTVHQEQYAWIGEVVILWNEVVPMVSRVSLCVIIFGQLESTKKNGTVQIRLFGPSIVYKCRPSIVRATKQALFTELLTTED